MFNGGDYWRNVREQAEREHFIRDSAYRQGYEQGYQEGCGLSNDYNTGFEHGIKSASDSYRKHKDRLWMAVVILALFCLPLLGTIATGITGMVKPCPVIYKIPGGKK